MLADRDTLVWKFGGSYGRLCALVAAALTNGHAEHRVLQASRGEGSEIAPVYRHLRRQRARMNSIILLCREAGIPDDVLLDAGRDSARAVEQEFMMRIPRM